MCSYELKTGTPMLVNQRSLKHYSQQPKEKNHPAVHGRMNGHTKCNLCTMDDYSATTWMNLKDMLSQLIQAEKIKYDSTI